MNAERAEAVRCWERDRRWASIIAVCVLAGCGQKGPLYLPTEQPSTNEAPTPAEQSDSAKAPLPDVPTRRTSPATTIEQP